MIRGGADAGVGEALSGKPGDEEDERQYAAPQRSIGAVLPFGGDQVAHFPKQHTGPNHPVFLFPVKEVGRDHRADVFFRNLANCLVDDLELRAQLTCAAAAIDGLERLLPEATATRQNGIVKHQVLCVGR